MSSFNHYITLIYQKSLSDLKAEARRGSLGILWWIVEPLLYVSVFYVIFSLIFDRGGDNAIQNLLTGLIVWKWFDSCVRQSSTSIITNAGLIRQVYIPKVILPIMVVMTGTMKFAIIFAILLVFLTINNGIPSSSWLTLPIIILIQFVVSLSIGAFAASIVPFFPDLRLLIDNGMTLLFFLSGIFFNIETVSVELQGYLYMNPMVGLIESYRTVLLNNELPDFKMLTIILSVSLLVLFLAIKLLARYDREYIKVI